MKSSILFSSLIFFLGCLGLHAALWRIRRPRRQAQALLAIFFIPLAVWMLFGMPASGAENLSERFAVALLHVSLACAYIQIYPASQADSPSLRILQIVKSSMPAGMKAEEIVRRFDEARLFHDRLEDLLNSGLALREGGRLMITAKGRALASPFLLLRRLLGLPVGEG